MSPLDAGVLLALADPASLTGLQKNSEQSDTLNLKGRQQGMEKKNNLTDSLKLKLRVWQKDKRMYTEN